MRHHNPLRQRGIGPSTYVSGWDLLDKDLWQSMQVSSERNTIPRIPSLNGRIERDGEVALCHPKPSRDELLASKNKLVNETCPVGSQFLRFFPTGQGCFWVLLFLLTFSSSNASLEPNALHGL